MLKANPSNRNTETARIRFLWILFTETACPAYCEAEPAKTLTLGDQRFREQPMHNKLFLLIGLLCKRNRAVVYGQAQAIEYILVYREEDTDFDHHILLIRQS